MKKILLVSFLIIAISSCIYLVWRMIAATHIAIITDIDYCVVRNPIPEGHIASIIEHVESTRSETLISLGDNISYRVGNCSDTAQSDLTHIITQLKVFRDQNIFVLGDHDISNKQESIDQWHQVTDQENLYFDFMIDDIHIIVLDTVLGGDQLAIPCKEDPTCLQLRSAYEASRSLPDSEESIIAEKSYKKLRSEKKLTRNAEVRDRGRIGTKQREWLRTTLTTSPSHKFLIVSDHPLFPFESHRKSYHIDGQEEVEKILQEKKDADHATIIAVSGEAHVWHREQRNGIDYYIVDEHKNRNAWALLTWGAHPAIWRMEGKERIDKVTRDFAYYRKLQGLPLTEE